MSSASSPPTSARTLARTLARTSAGMSWLSLNTLCTSRTRTRNATCSTSDANRSRDDVMSYDGDRSSSAGVTVCSTTASVSAGSSTGSSTPVTCTAA